MRAPGRHGAESPAGAGDRWTGDPAVRPGTTHRTPAPAAGATTFPRAEAALLRSSARAAGGGGSSSSERRLQRCQQLRAARPPPRLGRGSPRPGPGPRPAGGAEGCPAPRPGCLRGERCSSAAKPALTAGPGSRPARRRSRGGTGGAAEAAAPGRALLGREGGGAARSVPYSVRAGLICTATGQKAPGGAGSTGTAVATTSTGSAGREPGRAAPALGRAGHGPSPPPPSLLSSLPSRQSPPSVGGGAPAAARPGTLQAE